MNQADFLLISDPRIWAIPVVECGEPLIDLKGHGLQLSLARAPYYIGFSKVRKTVAEKLLEAEKHLPHGLKFLFSEGHRPLSLQKQIYEEYYNELSRRHRDWQPEKLLQEVSKFIAPPLDVPPHSTGGAFDINLIDAFGRELDMGSILDEDPEKNDYRNFTLTPKISDQAKKNRQYLIDALTDAGFVNYPAEWWHWSYGDKYWAYHKAQDHAIYDSITDVVL